jgi:hypothetical protein
MPQGSLETPMIKQLNRAGIFSDAFFSNVKPPGRPKVISRAEAKAAGLKRYFTGLPCPNGHIAARFVRQGNCTECHLDHQRQARFVLAAYWKSKGAASLPSSKPWAETLPDLPSGPLRRAAEISYRALAVVIMTRELSPATNAIAVAGLEALQEVLGDERGRP